MISIYRDGAFDKKHNMVRCFNGPKEGERPGIPSRR
jgi:hypothetical protein